MHAKTNSSLKIKTNITTNCKTNSLKTNDNDKNETAVILQGLTVISQIDKSLYRKLLVSTNLSVIFCDIFYGKIGICPQNPLELF